MVGTIMNLRVYERHTSIAWAQMSLTLLSRVLVSDSNGDNKSGQEDSFGFWCSLMMYCFPQIASEKSGCIADG